MSVYAWTYINRRKITLKSEHVNVVNYEMKYLINFKYPCLYTVFIIDNIIVISIAIRSISFEKR